MMTTDSAMNSQIVPYLVGGTLVALFLRRQFDARDLLIIAGVGYVAYSAYRERRSASAAAESATQQIVRDSLSSTSVARKGRELLAGHTELSPLLAALYRRFGRDNTVLREAGGFLARFAAYYRRFIAGNVAYDLSELQHVHWTMRMAINSLLSLDVQVQDRRPFRRGQLHPLPCERSLHRDVRRIDTRLRAMFTEMRSAAELDSAHFEVAPTSSWEEPYADRWKLV